MTAEDAEITRNVRRELGKRPVDSTMVDIQVRAGKITLTGRLVHTREQKSVNLRAEIEHVAKALTRDRIVKGFFDQLQYVVDFDDGKDEKNSRGRMRSR